MVKTVWVCEDCGQEFKSRAARLYHRNHSCPILKEREEVDGGKVVVDIGTETNTESKTDTGGNATADTASETESSESDTRIADAVDRFKIVKDEEESEDMPVVIAVIIIIFAMLITGVLVFREKIMDLLGNKPRGGSSYNV